MDSTTRTPAGEALTRLLLDLFRVNSLLATAGDRLVAQLGLTSARWQILGEISRAERPLPVAWLARNLGANRQNVQRIINDLCREGFVKFEPNPHHRRAQLVLLTERGRQTLDAARRLQAPWVNGLSSALPLKDIERTHRIIAALRETLEGSGEAEERVSRPGAREGTKATA